MHYFEMTLSNNEQLDKLGNFNQFVDADDLFFGTETVGGKCMKEWLR